MINCSRLSSVCITLSASFLIPGRPASPSDFFGAQCRFVVYHQPPFPRFTTPTPALKSLPVFHPEFTLPPCLFFLCRPPFHTTFPLFHAVLPPPSTTHLPAIFFSPPPAAGPPHDSFPPNPFAMHPIQERLSAFHPFGTPFSKPGTPHSTHDPSRFSKPLCITTTSLNPRLSAGAANTKVMITSSFL